MKGIIKQVLRNRGWFVRKSSGLPAGVDLHTDISRDANPRAFEVVVDVGANVGHMSKTFAECFEKAHVYSFEPIPDTFAILKQSTANVERISTHQLALSDTTGVTEMFLQADCGLNSLSPAVNRPDQSMDGRSIRVKTEPLGSWCESHDIQSIDLLKIDTEGHDIQVLKGAEKMLAAGRIQYILVEASFHPDNQRNTPFSQLNDYLFPFGYKVRGIHDQSTYGHKTFLTCVNVLYLLQRAERPAVPRQRFVA